MREDQDRKDVYVLVADLDMSLAMKGLLDRNASLGIRPIEYDISRHLNRDPGCRTSAPEYLECRAFSGQWSVPIIGRSARH